MDSILKFFTDNVALLSSLAAFLAILTTVVWFFRSTIFRRFRKPDGLAALADSLVDKFAASERDKALLSQENTQLKEQLQAALRLIENSSSEERAGYSLADAQEEIEAGRTEIAEAMLHHIAEVREAEGRSRIKEAAEAWRALGALAYLHNTDAAIGAYKKATELDPLHAGGWNMLGILLHRIGELNGAESAYGEALKLAEKFEDKVYESVALGNLGIVYQTRGDLERAEEMYGKSLAIEEELGRKEGMATAYGNLGIVYKSRGDLERAEEMYGKSLAIEEELGRKEGMASDYGNLGNVHLARGDLDQAEEMYAKSMVINKELGRKEGMAINFGNLGAIYAERDEVARAREAWAEALALFRQIGAKDKIAMTERLIADLDVDDGK